MSAGVTIDRIEAFAYRVPLETPVATSFGTMRDRPAVFVRLTDTGGAFGWGEVFANWPAAGAEHRVNLLIDDLADLVTGKTVAAPSDLFHGLERATHIRALQCGEWGPFRQCIAGLDTALHDLFARRAGLPLGRMLDPGAASAVPAYASGIAIGAASGAIDAARRDGHRAFKVKVGFDDARDLPLLTALAESIQDGERLFADANQAWTLAEALAFAGGLKDAGVGWLEEPIPADAPAEDWAALAARSPVPLAAGENIAGFADFERALASRTLRYVQPDIAKWGGITGCLHVARAAQQAGAVYCPHFLGGGIGLAASAHLLAAVGGEGLLEIDVNPNPLRDAFAAVRDRAAEGAFRLAPGPGLGIDALPDSIARHRTHARSRHVE